MSKIKLKDIQKLINSTTHDNKTLKINDISFPVRTNLLIAEKLDLIDTAVKNSLIDYITPSLLKAEAHLKVGFVQLICPEFEMPMNGSEVDVEQAALLIESLELIELYTAEANTTLYAGLLYELQRRMEFETAKIIARYGRDTQTDEVLENVSDFTLLLVRGMGMLLDKLEGLDLGGLSGLLGAFGDANVDDSDYDLEVNGDDVDNVVSISDAIRQGT